MNKAQRLAKVIVNAINDATINIHSFSMTVATFARSFGCNKAQAQEALWILRDAGIVRECDGRFLGK